MRDHYIPAAVCVNDLLRQQEQILHPVQGWSKDKRRFRDTIDHELGELDVHTLSARDLVAWAETRAASYATADVLLATLSGVLRDAIVTDHIEISPSVRRAALDARRTLRALGRVRTAIRRHPRLTDDDVERIRARWGATRLPSAALLVLVDTAMRSGELVRLRWEDWDARRGTVIIRDRKHPGRKHGNDQEIPLLRRARGIVDALSLSRSATEPRIFPATQTQISAAFRRAADAAGFPDHRLHDLRAEGITRLGERGVDMLTIQSISGHKSLAVLARYFHPDPALLHRIWDDATSQAAATPEINPRLLYSAAARQ